MTHLRIQQSDSAIEQVSSAVIAKLYELATSGNLDQDSNLVGRLNTTATYQDYVTYLTTNYPNLYITATNIYVKFEDPIAEKSIADAIGDGVGTTMTQILAYNQIIPSWQWFGGKNITKLNELALFTNARWEGSETFKDSTYLQEISFPNGLLNTTTGNAVCQNCTNLRKVTLPASITTIGARFAQGCGSLTQINTSNIQTFGNYSFYSCTSLSTLDISSVITIGEFSIVGLNLSGPIVFPNTLTYIGSEGVSYMPAVTSIEITSPSIQFSYSCFAGMSGLEKVIIRCTSVPNLLNTKTFEGSYPIYVVDSLLTNYQQASTWNDISSRLHGISELPQTV